MTLGEEDAFKVVGWGDKLKLHGYSSSTVLFVLEKLFLFTVLKDFP